MEQGNPLVHPQPLPGLLATLLLTGWGIVSIKQTPLDAIPDLSDVQVIIRTTFPGQSPRVVEEQVTYPITTTMLAVPGAQTVRGYSFFGDSYVYVIFEDGTDLYWARSRVLEYLNQAAADLPAAVSRGWGRTRPASVGSTATPWWTAPGGTTWPSCAACRTGSSSSSCRRSRAWRRSPPWAAWCASTRSS